MYEHLVTIEYCHLSKKTIIIKGSKNILMKTKLFAESIRAIVLYDKVVFMVVRDKT